MLDLIISLVVVGIVLWALNTFVPMDGQVKKLLNVVVIVALVIWLLQVFGLLHALDSVRVPRAR